MEATVIYKNQTQFIRIPKELAFPERVKSIHIYREGESLVITPKELEWSDIFEKLEALGAGPFKREWL